VRGKVKYAVGVLLIGIVVGAFYTCSPQKTLARRIKEADRMVFACNVPGYEDLKTSFTGSDVKMLARAIADARKVSPNVACSPESRLEFFKGLAHLVTITNCVQVFWIGKAAYYDASGTLEKLNHTRRQEYDERHLKSL
jgi:hypothetical protein